MRIPYINYLFVTLALIATGCKSEGEKACPDLKPVATFNSPVLPGETIKFSVSGVDDAVYYHWYGPDNFSSHEASPEIYNANGFHSGRYSVDIATKYGCHYTVQTDSLAIENIKMECEPQDNTGGFNQRPLRNITVTRQTEIHATTDIGDELKLYFKTPGTPPPGIYHVSGSELSARNDVHITFLTSSMWSAQSGDVYVFLENGKTVVQYCNLGFTSSSHYGTVLKSSARILL